MTKIIRNVVPIKKDKTNNTTSVILLATSIERESRYLSKHSLVWEIIQLQIQIIRAKFPKIDLIIVSKDNFDQVLSIKEQYSLRIVPNLHGGNENEMQDIKFGISSCLSHNVIIICGNILFSDNILQGISGGPSKILVDENEPQLKSENVGVIIAKNRVLNFGYDIYPKWGRIIYLDKDDFPKFANIATYSDNTQRFLFEGFNQFIEKYSPIATYSPRSYMLRKIYTGGDIKKIKQHYGIS